MAPYFVAEVGVESGCEIPQTLVMAATLKKKKKPRRNFHQRRNISYQTFQPNAEDRLTCEIRQPPPATSTTPASPLWLRMLFGLVSNTGVRCAVYFIGVNALWLLGDHVSQYQAQVYIAMPKNAVNEYFVKLGWLWTMVAVIPFSLAAAITHKGVVTGTAQSLLRAAMTTGVWFGVTTLFDRVKSHTEGKFDFSGHCFLLVWANMVLAEESKAYLMWDDCRMLLLDSLSVLETDLSLHRLFVCLRWLTPPMRVMLVLQTCLSLLWDVMLTSTALFFHTWPEKVTAVAVALFAWIIVYRSLFTLSIFGVPRQLGQETWEKITAYADNRRQRQPKL